MGALQHGTSLISVTGALAGFYLHRNTINYLITPEKRVFIFWAVAVLTATFVFLCASYRPAPRTMISALKAE
jgi:Mn2+/Fe2+ NRAMP family transporter